MSRQNGMIAIGLKGEFSGLGGHRQGITKPLILVLNCCRWLSAFEQQNCANFYQSAVGFVFRENENHRSYQTVCLPFGQIASLCS